MYFYLLISKTHYFQLAIPVFLKNGCINRIGMVLCSSSMFFLIAFSFAGNNYGDIFRALLPFGFD